jgi:hypothetical protein
MKRHARVLQLGGDSCTHIVACDEAGDTDGTFGTRALALRNADALLLPHRRRAGKPRVGLTCRRKPHNDAPNPVL